MLNKSNYAVRIASIMDAALTRVFYWSARVFNWSTRNFNWSTGCKLHTASLVCFDRASELLATVTLYYLLAVCKELFHTREAWWHLCDVCTLTREGFARVEQITIWCRTDHYLDHLDPSLPL